MARIDPSFRLRIPNDLLDKLRVQAEANKRSVSQEMVFILSNAIQIQGLAERIAEMESRIKEMEGTINDR